MKIMIADDHPLYAEGLRNLLYSNDFEIVGIAKEGKEAVETAFEKKPDIILMDIEMPVISGIEATRRIKERLSEVKIIILTSFEEEDSLIKAIKAGASGYLLKSVDGEELINSLREIEKGKNPFSPGLEDFLLNEIRQTSTKNRVAPLSERQEDVVRLLSKGLTYQEIAARLYLSESTIKYHMEQIKEKLKLKTQAQVIAYAKDTLKYN